MNNQTEKVTAYVVKYALTNGIETVQADILTGRTIAYGAIWGRKYLHGNEWALSRAKAVQLANAKLAKAIKATEANLAKLKKIKF